MKVNAPLTKEHVGKFTVIRADQRSIPVQIVAVGGGTCVWKVLNADGKMNLVSGQCRYDESQAINIYDTAEEALAWDKE